MARTTPKPPTRKIRTCPRAAGGRSTAIRALQLETEIRTDPSRRPTVSWNAAEARPDQLAPVSSGRHVQLQGHALGDGDMAKSLERDPQLESILANRKRISVSDRLRSQARPRTRLQPRRRLGRGRASDFKSGYFSPPARHVRRRKKRACACVNACSVWIRSSQQGAAFPCRTRPDHPLKTVLFPNRLSARPSTARSLRDIPTQSGSVFMALAGANPTSTAGSPIRYRGVRKASSMRSVNALQTSRRLASARSQHHRSGLRFYCCPGWRGAAAWPACGMGPQRRHPVNASRSRVALCASIDRMSPPRWC